LDIEPRILTPNRRAAVSGCGANGRRAIAARRERRWWEKRRGPEAANGYGDGLRDAVIFGLFAPWAGLVIRSQESHIGA